MHVRATTWGLPDGVHANDAVGGPNDAQQPSLAGLLAAAHARPLRLGTRSHSSALDRLLGGLGFRAIRLGDGRDRRAAG